MDINQAQAQGLCFKCGKHGHISHNCPNNLNHQDPAYAQAFVADLSNEEHNVLLRELGVGEPAAEAKGFQNAQE
jgi:hypothetical protein